MHTLVAAGAAFLLAVLWFDLMFDVQTRGHSGETLPPEILASISFYYRRVTTEAKPMNRLVGLVMILTVAALVAEILLRETPVWLSVASLLCALSAIALAFMRTVRNAVELGSREGSHERRSRLARTIYRDHRFCFVAMAAVAALQLAAG